jgi:hypothetical protein
LTNADAAYDIVQVGAAPAPLGWLYHQVLAPQRHLEQVSLSLVVGGIPPLPPLGTACAQRRLCSGDGAGIGECGAFGPEASDAFIDWLDDQVVAGEGDLASP